MLWQTFARCNTLPKPQNWGLCFRAVAALLIVFRRPAGASRIVTAILGIVWLWLGIGFCMVSIAPLYPFAHVLGALFMVQGGAFLYAAWRELLSFTWRADSDGVTGLALALFGLVIYRSTGCMAGVVYPQIPISGAPCTAAMFTFGLLLLTTARVPLPLLAIPILWALGTVVPVAAGMWSDLVLLIGGVLASMMIVYRDRRDVE